MNIINMDSKLKMEYCIPLWLRDEQIKLAIERKLPMISMGIKRDDPIALVSYGPSLNDTWEKIREFNFVLTCSGSHRFLIDKGIIPTYHIEVDPRRHKIDLLGQPHKDVQYIIASTCHPDYFDHLKDYNVKLWHIFDSKEDALRTLPPKQYALTGGCSAGLRTLIVARFMGFINQHIFGMDGCIGNSGNHAGKHPNQQKDHSIIKYKDREFKTTPSIFQAARETFHELDQMPDVKPVFYGDGLVQAMFKDYVPKPNNESPLAFDKPELISAEYCFLNKKLHRDNLAYGVGGGRYSKVTLDLARSIGTNSILDYGCGKGYLAKEIPFPIWEYDPAIEGKQESPRPADLVICTDVLEHIEPDKILAVLHDLKRVTKKIGYFVIHTGPSTKTLDDGRNTHLLQRDAKWWRKILGKFFTVGNVWDVNPLIHVIVSPYRKLKAA